MIKDPVLHTHIEDCLNDDHPLAWKQIYCKRCEEQLHAGNNECMQTWIETGKGSFCFTCFISEVGDVTVIEDDYGLEGNKHDRTP